MLSWPEHFHRWVFWSLKETVQGLLMGAIAFELAFRTFRAFPATRTTISGVLLLVILVVALAGMLVGPAVTPSDLSVLASRLISGISNAAIWLFTALAAVILWYRLRVNALHRAILMGFVPYLLVFSVGIKAVSSTTWHFEGMAGYVHPVA